MIHRFEGVAISSGYAQGIAVVYDFKTDYRLEFPDRDISPAEVAALFALEEILELADFVSIGTNDLTQYMLATDRRAVDWTDECTPWHPAVLRAIKQVVNAAAAKNCPVCVSGEEAGEADFACLLVRLGVRELSMTPVHAAAVRYRLRGMDASKLQELANQALRCATPKEVRQLLAR